MPEAVRVRNVSGRVHSYTDRENDRTIYVWPPGAERDVPGHVASVVTAGHPDKLQVSNRMVDSREGADLHPMHYFRKTDGVCACGVEGPKGKRAVVKPGDTPVASEEPAEELVEDEADAE